MNKLDPKAIWLFFFAYFRSLPLALFVLFLLIFGRAGLFEGLLDHPWLSFAMYLIVILALSYVLARLQFRFYRYELTDDAFRKESGIITKRYVSIPYDRIQNVDIVRGLTSRILSLSDLQIQTAGASAVTYRGGMFGSGAEGRLLGVSKEVAEYLRNELISRAKTSRVQGL